jgi:hypothetical protein
MKLITKPDFERAQNMWQAFWEGGIIKRPLVVSEVLKTANLPESYIKEDCQYYNAVSGNYDAALKHNEDWLHYYDFPAETIPFRSFDHGPDQFAACLGASLKFSAGSKETNWLDPFLDSYENTDFKIDRENNTFKGIIEYINILKKHGKEKYLVGMPDTHSNIDALSAMRGPEQLCMDIFECPESVEKAMRSIRNIYSNFIDAVYEAGGMKETGCIGWIPMYSREKFAVIQADFITMIGSTDFRRFVMSALEEEASFLDRTCLHLDGPGALKHLDDILSIKEIDAVQWVSGAGQPPMWSWKDVLKKIQNAGKGLIIYDLDCEEAKNVYKELKPEKLVFQVWAGSIGEIEKFCGWLEKNT